MPNEEEAQSPGDRDAVIDEFQLEVATQAARERFWTDAVRSMLRTGVFNHQNIAAIADFMLAEYDKRNGTRDKPYFGLPKDKS